MIGTMSWNESGADGRRRQADCRRGGGSPTSDKPRLSSVQLAVPRGRRATGRTRRHSTSAGQDRAMNATRVGGDSGQGRISSFWVGPRTGGAPPSRRQSISRSLWFIGRVVVNTTRRASVSHYPVRHCSRSSLTVASTLGAWRRRKASPWEGVPFGAWRRQPTRQTAQPVDIITSTSRRRAPCRVVDLQDSIREALAPVRRPSIGHTPRDRTRSSIDHVRVNPLRQSINTCLRVTIDAQLTRSACARSSWVSATAPAFLTAQPLFAGRDDYRSRDYRFLGSIGYWDKIFLDLDAGDNEIVVAVSETLGAWGVMARCPDAAGAHPPPGTPLRERRRVVGHGRRCARRAS